MAEKQLDDKNSPSVGMRCEACGTPMPIRPDGSFSGGGCQKCGGATWVGTIMLGGSAPSSTRQTTYTKAEVEEVCGRAVSEAREQLLATRSAIAPLSGSARELVQDARTRLLRAWEKSGEGALGPLSDLLTDLDHWLQGTRRTERGESQPLEVALHGGALSITIGIDTLGFAVTKGNPSFNNPLADFRVTNAKEFALAILHELNREDEQGTTRVHRMLDKAAEEAVNQGAEGIEEARRAEEGESNGKA